MGRKNEGWVGGGGGAKRCDPGTRSFAVMGRGLPGEGLEPSHIRRGSSLVGKGVESAEKRGKPATSYLYKGGDEDVKNNGG